MVRARYNTDRDYDDEGARALVQYSLHALRARKRQFARGSTNVLCAELSVSWTHVHSLAWTRGTSFRADNNIYFLCSDILTSWAMVRIYARVKLARQFILPVLWSVSISTWTHRTSFCGSIYNCARTSWTFFYFAGILGIVSWTLVVLSPPHHSSYILLADPGRQGPCPSPQTPDNNWKIALKQ